MNAARRKPDNRKSAWSPELRIALLGFLAAFPWEMWQMPFYEMRDISVIGAVRGCSLGALGDAGIMTGGYAVTGKLTRDRYWYLAPSLRQILIYLGIGLAVTIAVEQLAIRSRLGWGYSARMPIEPLTGTGLVPIAMWIAVPLIVLLLARHLSTPRPGS